MKKLLLIIVFVIPHFFAVSQEICNNAIDDDGDGFIDLNDPECDCSEVLGEDVASLIPNHSFEDSICCPIFPGQLNCAVGWIQASDGTSDYFNVCDYGAYSYAGIAEPVEMPLPGEPGGEAFAGFISNPLIDYNELIGTSELLGPLIAGTEYEFEVHLAHSYGNETLNFAIYGSPNSDDLPWIGEVCPIGIGEWMLLGSEFITFETSYEWNSLTVVFTPIVDIYAIAFGGKCDDYAPDEGIRMYIDELRLEDSGFDLFLESTGSWCGGDLTLTGITDDFAGDWQWYKDGIALIGEVTETLNPIPYGEGEFTVTYTVDSQCKRVNYLPLFPFEVEGITEDICLYDIAEFTNLSDLLDPDIVGWQWRFGDGATSDLISPTHEYETHGTYEVNLIGYGIDSTCNDTITIPLNILPVPEADLAIDGVGMFLYGANLVGCMNNPINFEDNSTIEDPSTITEWFWDFGDGNTSDEENPEYVYELDGSVDVVLIVSSEFGCQDTVIFENLFLTELIADFIGDSGCTLDELFFENTSSVAFPSEFDSWAWDFGDGESAISEDANHTYETGGIYPVELIAYTESGCSDTIVKLVDIFPTPLAGIEFIVDGISSETGGTGGCFTSEVQFNDLSVIDPSAEIVSWNWNFGDGSTSTDENPTHFYDSEGLYSVELIVESENGCTSMITIDILMTNGLAYLTSDTTICQNGTAFLHAASSDGSPHIYSWSIPDSDNSPDQIIEGLEEDYWVYVSAENAAGCISPIDSILITVLEPISLEISPPDTVCIGDPSGATVIVVGGRGDYIYTWTANGFPVPENAPVITTNPIITTEYCVTVEDGCETDPVTICTETYVPAYPSFTSDTTEGCEPTEIEFTDLTGPDPTLNSSTWYINGDVLYGNPVSYEFTEPGSYNVTLNVLSPEGCTSSSTVSNYITIHPLPTPALNITPNPTTYFNTTVEAVNISPNISSSFTWSTPGALTSEAISDSIIEVVYPELVSGDYKISIIETTEFGCVDSAQLTLIIYSDQLIYAPNAFTPGNGDNLNDTWGVFIEGIDVYNFHLRIYNRWGELIWESYNPSAQWDGTYFDIPVEQGVYVWVVQANDLEFDKGYEFKGFVTVIR